MAHIRNFLGQVGRDSRGRQDNVDPSKEPEAKMHSDADLADAMGSFASPKRFGHYGLMSDVSTLAYETNNGLLAVASRDGVVKVLGGPGVELVLREQESLDDPPSYLLFPTPGTLVGITAAGSFFVWDLKDGNLCGHLVGPLDPCAPDDTVTAVHCSHTGDLPTGADNNPAAERYVYVGFDSGSLRVVQVLPECRVSGYVIKPRDMATGALEDMQSPEGGGTLGAVTALACSGEAEGGMLGLIGFRYGGVVLWDWIRHKRLALHGMPAASLGEDVDPAEREVTSLAFHPGREAFAAGFASGCYAVFPAAATRDQIRPRWVAEIGDGGSSPREGPTIVRTPVSLVQWVGVRQGERRLWGLVVAGGVEIDEGEDPDGVSLLMPCSGWEDGVSPSGPSSGGRAPKHAVVTALSPLETTVFVPFAIGQERLSFVHAVRLDDTERKDDAGHSEDPPTNARGEAIAKSDADAWGPPGVSRQLVVFGLVDWTEEVRSENGRLHFRRASSIKACPVQTAPYVALLQLAPERLGPHLSGFAPVTTVATTPLLSSATILNFVTCLTSMQRGQVQDDPTGGSSNVLRGGGLRWAESVSPLKRDEAISTVEMLVMGHSNGCLSFWECCGPVSRQEGVSISDGRVHIREIPSSATFLGSLNASEVSCGEGVACAVTALDIWIERDHVAAVERDACWIAVGFEVGEAAVFALTNQLQAGDAGDCPRGAPRGRGNPLVGMPISITNVKMNSESDDGGADKQGWSALLGRGDGEKGEDDEEGDMELEAAIAAARAEALVIQAGDASGGEGDRGSGVSALLEAMEGSVVEGSSGRLKEGSLQGPVTESLDAELREGHAAASSHEPIDEDKGRDPSLLQLTLRLHGHAVRCVALSYDTSTSSLAMVVADAEGVVSVTDVATGSASLLPMRAPHVRPCFPAVAIGPVPDALGGGARWKPQPKQSTGSSGALFVLLEGWLNVFDLASREPLDVVEVPGLELHGESVGPGQLASNVAAGGLRGLSAYSLEEEGAWITCVDELGVPIVPYASESPFSFARSPVDSENVDEEVRMGGGEDAGERPAASTRSRARNQTETVWVSPYVSRTALERSYENELQILSGSQPPKLFLLIVRGATAVVVAITRRDSVVPAFSRRSVTAVAAQKAGIFKGKSAAQLSVKARLDVATEGSASLSRIDGVGVCLVPVSSGDVRVKAPRRGCLVTTDVSGRVKALLLPSLTPIFSDEFLAGDRIARLGSRPVAPSRKLRVNLVGELLVCGASQELTRWSLLTDEAYEMVLDAKQRLVKVPYLVRPPTVGLGSRQSSAGSPNDSQSTSQSRRGSRRILARMSLGGSNKKTLAEAFAVEEEHTGGSSRSAASAQSSSGHSPSKVRGRGSVAGKGDVQERQRQALFGDREAERAGPVEDAETAGGARAATSGSRGGVSEAQAAIKEAHDLAVLRGEKLGNVVDRTRQLEDSALAFGEMAKQLRRQQEEEACSIT